MFVVHLLGWRGPAPELRDFDFEHVRSGDLGLRHPARLLVLGPRAPETCDPVTVSKWLRAERRRLLACFDPVAAEARAWHGVVGEAWIGPHELAAALERAAREIEAGLVPFSLEPAEWLPPSVEPPDPRSPAGRALAALSRVRPVYSVSRWAQACGMDADELRTLMKRSVGICPRPLSLLFVGAQVRRADHHGVDRASTASTLGYSDVSALGHAMERGRR